MAYDLFEVTQGAIIKNSEGAVLLLELEDGHSILPGGHVDHGEDWEVALRRELKEELNLEEFTIKKLVDISSWAEKDAKHSIYTLTFLIEAPGFKEPVLSNEHVKYSWVTLQDLDQHHFFSEILKNRVRKGLEDRSLL